MKDSIKNGHIVMFIDRLEKSLVHYKIEKYSQLQHHHDMEFSLTNTDYIDLNFIYLAVPFGFTMTTYRLKLYPMRMIISLHQTNTKI